MRCGSGCSLKTVRFGFLGAVVSVSLSFPAVAAGEFWKSKPFQYAAVDQSVNAVLQEFSAATGVPVDVSENVRGQVHERWPDKTAGEFLSHLSRDYGLEWYYDGSMLAISASSETSTQLLPLGSMSFDQLRAGLVSAGLMETRFGLRAGPKPGTVVVTGPPRYLALVKQTLGISSPDVKTIPAGTKVTVHPGTKDAVVTTF